MTKLYLLRHGATLPNLERPYRLQGSSIDESLAPLGKQQSLAARDALRFVPLRAIYSSPLKRAKETGLIVGEPHGLELQLIPELREGSIGRWEGKTWDQIKAAEPEEVARFQSDPAKYGYPEGETFQQVLDRVLPIFESLLRKHQGESFAVVGHHIVNRSFVGHLMNLSMNNARVMKLSNGGISIISSDGKTNRVLSLNADLHVAHLQPPD